MCMSQVSRRPSACTVLVDIRAGLRAPGGWLGGYTGWVIPGTTSHPPTCQGLHPQGPTQRSGPRKPLVGAGVGGVGPSPQTRPRAVLGASASPPTHPAGPVGPGRPSLVGGLAPRAKGRDSSYISLELSKTAKCHQKVSKRPPVVPVSQNGSGKSPLEILRFPISSAFSPKELMVPFWPMVQHYCQNDEVSTVFTPCSGTRNGRMIPPRSPPASWLLVTAPHHA